MTSVVPALALNDGARIPQLGLGVMDIPPDDLGGVIATAVELGYRHVDTATHYGNEADVGLALARSDVPRDEFFVVTKLPNAQHGYDQARRALDRSEQAMGPIDLYLMHWPQPSKRLYLDSWRAMVQLRRDGRVRSIVVCNFPEVLLDELVDETGVMPAVNQVELHPAHQQSALRSADAARGIVTESWSPLGHGRSLSEPAIGRIAERLGTSPGAVILRWHLDLGLVAIPKASGRHHLTANFRALDLRLSRADHAAIARIDRGDGRFGPDPMTHTTEQGALS
jgi:2,5-diketo-D-gluconate reductase A